MPRFAVRRAARLLALAVFTFTLSLSAQGQAPDNPATKPVPREQPGWKAKHESHLARAKEGKVDVLFIGDSITNGWAGAGKTVWAERFKDWNPANFGIGGDRTQHVLWRITEGKELEGIEPKVVVMMIGTNNFGTDTPEQVAAGIKAILDSFQKQRPSTKILLLGVFPRSSKSAKEYGDAKEVAAADLHEKPKAVNKLIAEFANGKSIVYLDIGGKFLTKDGALPKSIMPDYIHLSQDGYKIWADAIEKPVNDLLKK